MEDTNQIRKISIGQNYKSDSMHYSVGQEVFGGHEITDIVKSDEGYHVYITRDNEMKEWKMFNHNMGISVEYDLEY